MSFSLRLALLPLVFAPVASLLAQTAPPVSSALKVGVLVTPRAAGEFVPSLTANDFEVLDNGKPLEVKSVLAPDADRTPRHAVIVVDDINVWLIGLSNEHLQVVKFLRSHGGKLPVPTRLAVLTSQGLRVTPRETTDGNSLAATLESFGTTLRNFAGQELYSEYERVMQSTTALGQLITTAATPGTETAILWVSPGWPLLSRPDAMLSNQARQSVFDLGVRLTTSMLERHVTLYALDPVGSIQDVGRANQYDAFLHGMRNPGDADFGNLGLQVLAIQSGGRAVNSNDTAGTLAAAYSNFLDRYQLTLDLPPASETTTFHKLRVRVKNPSLRVVARTGYYVPAASTVIAER